MHGKKERKQNMMQLCNLFFMIRHESHNRGTNCLRGFSVQANLKSSESRDRSDGLLSLILVVNCHLTKLKRRNLDALFFRLKTVCNKKKSIFVGEN